MSHAPSGSSDLSRAGTPVLTGAASRTGTHLMGMKFVDSCVILSALQKFPRNIFGYITEIMQFNLYCYGTVYFTIK